MESTNEGRRIARAIAKARTNPRDKLPKDLRREASAYAQHRKANGATRHAIARELQVADVTVSRWLEAPLIKSSGAPLPLRRVRVRDGAKAHSNADKHLVVIADGLRIEGMTIADVIALVRGLR